MGSTFTTLPSTYDQSSVLGNKKKIPVYLQLVPGIVIDVVTSRQSRTFGDKFRRINSIIAKPHISDKAIQRKGLEGEENRYFPLFRGMVDVPVIGDPVLLCTIGGVQYYLGPLNTAGSPNFNPDHLDVNNIQVNRTEKKTKTEQSGISINFKKGFISRLEKPFNEELDNPNGTLTGLSEIHGDMIFEGRHGNSLRIGSRYLNPYIIISNGRAHGNAIETSLDGSIFSMTNKGTIRQHFPLDFKLIGDVPKAYAFTLADSEIESPTRHIGITYKSGLGRGIGVDGEEDPDIAATIYGYNKNQVFMNSDRITINARKDSMFLAAFKHIHMGSGNSMTFSTSNNILMEAETELTVNSPKINLGSGVEGDTEPLVLGDMLIDWLDKLLTNLGTVSGIATGAGPSGPLSSAPNWTPTTEALKAELESLLSTQNRTT